ncbi:MAG TPA: hypothetical protein VJM33_04905 [Microthrixaceae bacterium]|nr:hypothetical protein [Microthrixaceae bacterium]
MSHAERVDPELAAMLSRCAVSRPWTEQDEGPYHRADQATRRDVVEDRDGVALQLGIRLAREGGVGATTLTNRIVTYLEPVLPERSATP